jgi:hypothetical protein
MAARRGDGAQSLPGNMSECLIVLRVSLSTSRRYGAFRSKARKQGALSRGGADDRHGWPRWSTAAWVPSVTSSPTPLPLQATRGRDKGFASS